MPEFRHAHFGLKHRVIAFVSTRLFRNYVHTIRHGLAAGMRRRGGLSFLPINSAATPESEFLAGLDLAGKTVYDVGGFEGLLTLFFARKAAAVVTFEPNPRNFQLCLENVALNDLKNVRVINRGLSSEPGSIELVYDPLMPGASSANREISDQIGGSVSSARRIPIAVGVLDSDMAELRLPPPDFIKIDIEGMELPALKGMQRTLATCGPEVFIELHGAEAADKRRNATDVIEFLERAGYRVFDVENRKYLNAATLEGEPPSHIYGTKTNGSVTTG